jgi:hypothetical protein
MDLPLGVDGARIDHRRSLLALMDGEFQRLHTTAFSHGYRL